MPTDLRMQQLHILSDLHLTVAGPQCVFRAHAALTAFIRHLATLPAPTDLLLNGDVFDFLQIPGYDGISLPLAGQRIDAILDSLAAEPPERNLVSALCDFTAAGHRLHCLPGNHDPELALAEVQQRLAARLGAARELPAHADSWRVEVAGRTVVGQHGHHDDAFNALPASCMLAAQAAGDASLPMPPGSKLVCRVINPYRRAADADGKPRFPFVDLLPSERAVVLALLALDGRLAAQRLGDALGIGAQALARKLLQSIGGGRLLAATPVQRGGAPAQDPADAFADAIAQCIAGTLTPEELAASQRMASALEQFLLTDNAQPVQRGLLSTGGGWIRTRLLSALGSTLDSARGAFDPARRDELADAAIDGWGRDLIAIAGHTHAPRDIRHGMAGHYLNSGSWLDSASLPAQTDAVSVADWLDRLQADALPRNPRRPVVRVDAGGAALLHWTGDRLIDWAERPADA
ncbi:metallophosphoesterase family protein [Derxia lacustris]|uniref:metallophosphoesterase n=1 Tax=Derxia lacustris TaxID=764842 RepID=UPI0015940AB1|nr:metallophosphoesterase [Derxia lacustris]